MCRVVEGDIAVSDRRFQAHRGRSVVSSCIYRRVRHEEARDKRTAERAHADDDEEAGEAECGRASASAIQRRHLDAPSARAGWTGETRRALLNDMTTSMTRYATTKSEVCSSAFFSAALPKYATAES